MPSLPQPMRKVRIESNGKPNGTFVYDAVNGERLDWIKAINLQVNPDRVLCELTVLVQVIDIRAEVQLDEVILAPVASDAKLPPCDTFEVDLKCGDGVEKPKLGSPTPWPFPSFVIGATK